MARARRHDYLAIEIEGATGEESGGKCYSDNTVFEKGQQKVKSHREYYGRCIETQLSPEKVIQRVLVRQCHDRITRLELGHWGARDERYIGHLGKWQSRLYTMRLAHVSELGSVSRSSRK